ncbi:MAG: beta strand repeat-containing protein [Candidatus Korobacteraceae bacterium]|jgi:hypothetical protein
MTRCLVVLCTFAVLLVTTSFASTRKSEPNRNASGYESDLSFRGSDLSDEGGSASGGVGDLRLSHGGDPGGILILPAGTPDNWTGGTGNWSNAGDWSAGEPGSNSDVTIYSGGNDKVTLDVSTTISSLTLGGAENGTLSTLTDGGIAQTLTITNALNIGATGVLDLTGGTAVTAGTASNAGTIDLVGGSKLGIAAGGLINFGAVDVEQGSAFYVVGDVTNDGEMVTGISLVGGGNVLNITGNLTNNDEFGWAAVGDTGTITGNVTNNGAFFIVANGATATVGGSLTNNAGGLVDVDGGGTLTITGDVTNSAGGNQQGIYTGLFIGGGNKLTIGGTLTNSGVFELAGPGDQATLGGLINSGDVEVGNGSTLQINGDVTNSFVIETGALVSGGRNTVNITGTLTNQGPDGFGLFGAGDMATIGGDLINSATVTVENGSMLTVEGNVTNSGMLGTDLFNHGGGSAIIVDGLLTNNAMGTVSLNGPEDVLVALSGLTNSGMVSVNNGSALGTPTLNNLGIVTVDSTSFLQVGLAPAGKGASPFGTGYLQTASGTLGEMIAGLNSFGVINVNGSALLDGTLAIMLQGSFNPAVGSTFKFLNFTPGALSGVFADIENDVFNGGTEKWLVDYDNADGFVELIAEPNQVPEPATLMVLIPGLVCVGYGLRRKLLR